MGSPKLSPDEQKVYDHWKKVCERHFKQLAPSVQFSCSVQKQQLEQKEIARRQLEGSNYITDTIAARQAEATVLLGGLMRASNEYDQILQARAALPVLDDIVVGLVTSFLPEAKVLGRIVNRYIPANTWRAIGIAAGKSSADGWEQLVDDVMNSNSS